MLLQAAYCRPGALPSQRRFALGLRGTTNIDANAIRMRYSYYESVRGYYPRAYSEIEYSLQYKV
jgi:hypothetical protein